MWYKQLGKDSIFYGFGSLAIKAVGLIVIPIYTRYFSPEIYGRIDLLLTISTLLSPIMVMGTDSAQSFYFFNKLNEKLLAKKVLVSSIFFWELIWSSFIFIISLFFIEKINVYFFNGEIISYVFVIIFLISFLSTFYSQFINLFRLERKPVHFGLLSLSFSVLNATLSIILLQKFNFQYHMVFIGNILALIIITPLLIYFNRQFLSFQSINFSSIPKILKFSFPFYLKD